MLKINFSSSLSFTFLLFMLSTNVLSENLTKDQNQKTEETEATKAEIIKETYEECLLNAVKGGAATKTAGGIRELCKQSELKRTKIKGLTSIENVEQTTDEVVSPIEKRFAIENLAENFPFLLVPHKRNYVLPITYNPSPNEEPYKDDNLELDPAEVKFQLSIKARMAEKIFNDDGDIWFGYTNISFWQAYNTSESSPFRETNHEPELFIDFHPNLKAGAFKSHLLRFGANHQSNGRNGSLSRSWNRVYALIEAGNKNFHFGLRPWYRIPENGKKRPDSTRGDDNPDIHKFVGYGDLLAFYRGDVHHFGATFRNNLNEKNRMGLQLDWTFPVTNTLRGYLQFYSGYGESLIDYDTTVNRIGLGIMFSDLL